MMRARPGPLLPRVERRSARVSRLRGRLPRIAMFAALGILAVAGLRAIVSSRPSVSPVVAAPLDAGHVSSTVGAFAEGFARQYLSWDTADPAVRERALAAYIAPSLGDDAGFAPPRSWSQRVVWSTPIAAREGAGGRWRVSVVAQTDKGATVYLIVPVWRTRGGAMVVEDYPALAPAPEVASTIGRPPVGDISDPDLVATVKRAIENYVRADARNLTADVIPGATILVPDRAFGEPAVTGVGWRDAARRTVAADVTVTVAEGVQMHLRFEAQVQRSGRWFVRAINDGRS